MTNALNEIERIKRAEQIKSWDASEKAMAERLAQKLDVELARREQPPSDETPSAVEQALKQNFVQWCADNNVRSCPAKPATVASWIWENRLSMPHDQLLETLSAIGNLHDKFNLANPCTTRLVRDVLELSIENTPPKSWRRDEQELWAFLPAEIRFIITRRELNRDKEVRRVQGELGRVNGELDTLRKTLNAETKTEETRTNGLGDADQRAAC
jgi:hypothetical protein